jgi:hypothetical protein
MTHARDSMLFLRGSIGGDFLTHKVSKKSEAGYVQIFGRDLAC